MRVAIYARVSTLQQTTDMQMESLKPFVLAKGWDLVGIYQDNGISGSKNSRPELDRLMEDARKRKFDVVLCFRFDRFARSVSHLLRALEEFKSLGVQFVSYSEGIDTSTSLGQAMFTVMGAFSQLERDVIRERVTTRVRQIITSGKKWGAPKKVFRRDLALEDLAAGGSLRSVAKKYGVSHTQLARERDCAKTGQVAESNPNKVLA